MISRRIATALTVLIAVLLLGCAEPHAGGAVDWSQRFRHVGQWSALKIQQSGESISFDSVEGANLVLGVSLSSISLPEFFLLATVRIGSTESDGEKLVRAFMDGVKNPLDTSSKLYLDAVPDTDIEFVKSLGSLFYPKAPLTQEEFKTLSARIDASAFATQAVIVRRMLIDMVYNKDALARVTKQVDELRSSSETDRERDYWAMTRAALELPNLAKAFTPPKPLAGREACRQNMSILTAAQMAYRVINKTELFAKNIRDLAAAMDGKPLPTCPDGGKYSVSVGVPKNAFTIHCSIAEHDAGGRGEPNGYSPGLNTK